MRCAPARSTSIPNTRERGSSPFSAKRRCRARRPCSSACRENFSRAMACVGCRRWDSRTRMRSRCGARLRIRCTSSTLSDLARAGGSLRAGLTPDFIGRARRPSRAAGGVRSAFSRRPIAWPAVKYQALAAGQVDVIDGYSTDGLIARYQLVVLNDDRHFFPPYRGGGAGERESVGRQSARDRGAERTEWSTRRGDDATLERARRSRRGRLSRSLLATRSRRSG